VAVGEASKRRATLERAGVKSMATTVCIIVDPDIGERMTSLAETMPVWIADTEANHKTVKRYRDDQERPPASHTEIGAVTTFRVDGSASLADWVIAILSDVDLHHGRYSQSPPYAALEVIGVTVNDELRDALAEFDLRTIVETSMGFRAE
jgi:hypothetical protein